MEPTAGDVMPKAILRESLTATGGTPREQAAREAGKRIVDKVKEGEWREALEAGDRKKPIEQKTIDRKLDEIGVERDAAGKKFRASGSEEEKRFNRAKSAADLAKKAVDQGYDKLDSATEQPKLRAAIEDKIKANPLLASEFNSLNPTQQRNEIERRLRDPKFLADLSEEANTHLNPERKLLDEQQIIEKQEEVKVKEFNKTEAEDAVTGLTDQIKALDAELKEFERSPSGSPVGKLAIEAESLRSTLSVTIAERDAHKTTLDDANTDLQDLINERQLTLRYGASSGRRDAASIEKDILSKRDEVKQARREVDAREAKIRRITELDTQEANLKEKKLQAETSKKAKDLDLKKADLELGKSQRILDDLKRVRVYQEEDLASNMENVFLKTADKYIRDEIEPMKARVDSELAEAKKKTSNADELVVLKACEKRWEKLEGSGTKIKRMVSKEKTAKDFQDLLGRGSPDNIIREMLKTQINTRTKVAYTDPDINVLLADKADDGFYKKMAPEVISQVIRRKILAGGLTKADVFNIQNSTWGEGMIMKALEKNKANAAELEALTGEKMVNPGFMPKVWEQTKKRPWLLLTLLGIVALPILAAKEGTSSIMK